jgi:hypothetical protein
MNYQELRNNSQTEACCFRLHLDIRIFEFCFTTLKSWTFLSRHWHHFSLDAILCETSGFYANSRFFRGITEIVSEWNNLWTTDGEYIYESSNTSSVYLQCVRIFYYRSRVNHSPITRKSDDETETVWRNLSAPWKWSLLFK